MPRSAAALIIGNEILTGKIRESNVQVLAREMRLLGVSLRRVIVCPDEIDVIAEDLTALRESHDLVFTSGGVGPTPDDVTLLGVARSFGHDLERAPEIEKLIRGYWKDRVTEGHLRMADVPAGAELLSSSEIPWPIVIKDNVFVLPGVPQIFAVKIRMLRDRIGAAQPFVSRALLTRCDEGSIAPLLERIEKEHPNVDIGSYPVWRDPEVKVKLTFDSLDADAVDAALAATRDGLDPADVVRAE